MTHAELERDTEEVGNGDDGLVLILSEAMDPRMAAHRMAGASSRASASMGTVAPVSVRSTMGLFAPPSAMSPPLPQPRKHPHLERLAFRTGIRDSSRTSPFSG